MAKFDDPAAAAIRLRTATASLTDLRDWEIARRYIRELEASAVARDFRAENAARAPHSPR